MKTYEKTVAEVWAEFPFCPSRPRAASKLQLTSLLAVVSALVLAFAACSFGGNSRDGGDGSDGSSGLKGGGIVTRIDPRFVIVKKGATQSFKAMLGDTPVKAAWSVIDENGSEKGRASGIAEFGWTVASDESSSELTVKVGTATAKVYVAEAGDMPPPATGEWPYGIRTDGWPRGIPRNMGIQIDPQVVVMGPGDEKSLASFDIRDKREVTWTLEETETVTDNVPSRLENDFLIIDVDEAEKWLTLKAEATDGSGDYGTAVIRVVRSKYFVRNGGTGSGSKEDSPLGTVADALNEIALEYKEEFWPGKGTNDEKPVEIVILDKMTSEPLHDIGKNYPQKITLSGKKNGSSTVKLNEQGSLITVKSGRTVTLNNITLEGLAYEHNAPIKVSEQESITIANRGDTQNNNAALVTVEDGELIMEDGAEIRGNYNDEGKTGGYGGGVTIGTNGTKNATFTMKGGTISNNIVYNNNHDDGCFGGGVTVLYGTFTMEGGTIKDNTAGSGGGVNVNEGTFTMSGGTIKNNNALGGDSYQGASGGGGVICVGGTFTMTSGIISGNISKSSDSYGFPNYGGGVYIIDKVNMVSAIFNKTGGEIMENTVINQENKVPSGLSNGNQVFAAAAVPNYKLSFPYLEYGPYPLSDGVEAGNPDAIQEAIEARPIAEARWCDDTVGTNDNLYYTTTFTGNPGDEESEENSDNYKYVGTGTWEDNN